MYEAMQLTFSQPPVGTSLALPYHTISVTRTKTVKYTTFWHFMEGIFLVSPCFRRGDPRSYFSQNLFKKQRRGIDPHVSRACHIGQIPWLKLYGPPKGKQSPEDH